MTDDPWERRPEVHFNRVYTAPAVAQDAGPITTLCGPYRLWAVELAPIELEPPDEFLAFMAQVTLSRGDGSVILLDSFTTLVGWCWEATPETTIIVADDEVLTLALDLSRGAKVSGTWWGRPRPRPWEET